MTKEEITICKIYLEEMGKDKDCNEYKLLMQMLEQRPSGDCVSREQAIKAMIDCINILDSLPPIVPTHGTCKDCGHRGAIYADGDCFCDKDGLLRVRGFYCKDFDKRG